MQVVRAQPAREEVKVRELGASSLVRKTQPEHGRRPFELAQRLDLNRDGWSPMSGWELQLPARCEKEDSERSSPHVRASARPLSRLRASGRARGRMLIS